MLANLKLLLGARAGNYSDDLLNLMLELAEDEVLAYTNRQETDASLEVAIINLVLARLNRMGAEGIASQNYSGISESYINGADADILRLLNSKRRIKVL